MTTVIPQIAGLNKILELIDNWGGKEKYFDLYTERNRRIREGTLETRVNSIPQ